jgi:hypothetical protein
MPWWFRPTSRCREPQPRSQIRRDTISKTPRRRSLHRRKQCSRLLHPPARCPPAGVFPSRTSQVAAAEDEEVIRRPCKLRMVLIATWPAVGSTLSPNSMAFASIAYRRAGRSVSACRTKRDHRDDLRHDDANVPTVLFRQCAGHRGGSGWTGWCGFGNLRGRGGADVCWLQRIVINGPSSGSVSRPCAP